MVVSLTDNAPLVVLVGAGLSKSVGLPLQRELLGAVVPRDIIRIHNYFGGHGLDTRADLETFLSSIDFDDLIETSSRSRPSLNSRIYLAGFCSHLLERMTEMPRRPGFWRRLTTLIQAADTMVTTNWDTLLEIQIRALGLGVSYFRPRGGVQTGSQAAWIDRLVEDRSQVGQTAEGRWPLLFCVPRSSAIPPVLRSITQPASPRYTEDRGCALP